MKEEYRRGLVGLPVTLMFHFMNQCTEKICIWICADTFLLGFLFRIQSFGYHTRGGGGAALDILIGFRSRPILKELDNRK